MPILAFKTLRDLANSGSASESSVTGDHICPWGSQLSCIGAGSTSPEAVKLGAGASSTDPCRAGENAARVGDAAQSCAGALAGRTACTSVTGVPTRGHRAIGSRVARTLFHCVVYVSKLCCFCQDLASLPMARTRSRGKLTFGVSQRRTPIALRCMQLKKPSPTTDHTPPRSRHCYYSPQSLPQRSPPHELRPHEPRPPAANTAPADRNPD